MLTKAVFKPFVENFYLQLGEKNYTYIILTPDLKKNTLKIEMKSLKGFYVSYLYENIEDGELKVADGFHEAIFTYSEFNSLYKQIKARNMLSLLFLKESLVLMQKDKKLEAIVSNSIKYHDSIINTVLLPTEISDTVIVNGEDMIDTTYLANFKLTLEENQQFDNITLKQINNELLFLATSGAALHCCKVKIDEEISDDNDYLIPTVYIKNMANICANYPVYMFIEKTTDENTAFLHFDTSDMQMKFQVKVINKEDSLFNSYPFSNWLRNEERMNYSLTTEFFKDEQSWKAFTELEAKGRKGFLAKKLDSIIKFTSLDNLNFNVSVDIWVDDKTVGVGSYTATILGDNLPKNMTFGSNDFIKFIRPDFKNRKELQMYMSDEVIVLKDRNRYMYVPMLNTTE